MSWYTRNFSIQTHSGGVEHSLMSSPIFPTCTTIIRNFQQNHKDGEGKKSDQHVGEHTQTSNENDIKTFFMADKWDTIPITMVFLEKERCAKKTLFNNTQRFQLVRGE